MDGVLRVTTTSTPSIVAFKISTIEHTIEGLIDIDFSALGVTTAADCITKLLDNIKQGYLELVMQEREEAKETLQ